MIQITEMVQDIIKELMAGSNHCLLFLLMKLKKNLNSVWNDNKEFYVILYRDNCTSLLPYMVVVGTSTRQECLCRRSFFVFF